MTNVTTNVTRIVLAVVTKTEEISLQCTTSLLRLQQAIATKKDLVLDFNIVTSFLDALNLHTKGDFLVIIDQQCSCSVEFVLGGLQHPAVVGVYPLGQVNWKRIETRINTPGATEPLRHAGNVYNIIPAQASLSRYLPVQSVVESKVLMIKSEEIAKITGPHTEYTDAQGVRKDLLAHPSVFENTLQNEYQTFIRKLQCPLVADVQEQCTLSANAQFAGCVGQRGFVR
jgi:hypothetical protein